MKVALVALMAAPAAMAYTPDNLRGVWSCVVEDGMWMERDIIVRSTVEEASFAVRDTTSKNHRVLVFDKPTNTQATRRFQGRSYYMHDDTETHIEEHSFSGMMKNGVDGSFFLDPNINNNECGPNCDVTTNAALVQVTPNKDHNQVLLGEYRPFIPTTNTVANWALFTGNANNAINPFQRCPDQAGLVPTNANLMTVVALGLAWNHANMQLNMATLAALAPTPADCLCQDTDDAPTGSCSERSVGPYEFTLDDADHMTLVLATTDMQAGNRPVSGTRAATEYMHRR